jgi:SAM-dependent methyltransferase
VTDEWLYAGAAPFYADGRLPYPARLATEIQAVSGLEGSGRLLDLGCGPGSLTLLLAPLFAEVVGVDADPGMVRVAGERSAELGIANVHWVHSPVETLTADPSSYDVVTLAQSFHWMDQPVVAERIHGWLRPGRSCVHVGAWTHEGDPEATGLPHPRPPREQITALVRSYLGPRRRAGKRVIGEETSRDEDAAFVGAGFRGSQRVDVAGGDVFVRSEDQVIASVLSLSSAAPHLFGRRLEAFVADLRALLRETSPIGRFSEQSRMITLKVWRK